MRVLLAVTALLLFGAGCTLGSVAPVGRIAQSHVRVSTNAPVVSSPLLKEDIAEFIERETQQFNALAASDADAGTREWQYELQIDGEPMLARGIETAMMRVYTYTGGAHGNTVFVALRRDLEDGTRPELIDLFRLNIVPENLLSTIARRDLPALLKRAGMGVDQSMLERGTEPKADNFASWGAHPDGLVVMFAPYAVAPYASGPQRLVIPWRELQSSLEVKYR